jgi:predicted esterase
MVKLYKPCMALVCLMAFIFSHAQTHNPRIISINSHTGGYYEYLPEGYQSNGAAYPLIIYLHGQGHSGNGSSELSKVLEAGLPKYINDGQFPRSFVVGGRTHRVIVISPQFNTWPMAGDVEAVINYAVATYNVDENRIYVTGMSMGGGATWDFAGNKTAYASKLAAIVPVCGASSPNGAGAHNIATTDLPVWATHNQEDSLVPVSYTNGYVNLINGDSEPPTPRAKKTIFPVEGHDAWTTTYNPAWKEGGLNIYEWMLQFQRAAAGGPLPVTLTDFRVSATGNEARLTWTTSWEDNNHHFTIEHSADGNSFRPITDVTALNQPTGGNYVYVDKKPYAGRNYYRLSQTDIDGKKVILGVRELLMDIGSRNYILYPNPAYDHFILGINQQAAGAVSVQVINAQGKIVRRDHYVKQNGYWQQRIPVDQLPKGMYTVYVKGSLFETTHKLLKN